MRLLRGFPAMALTVVLLSIVGFFVSQESVGLLLVCGALAAMSWYITEGPRGRSLPQILFQMERKRGETARGGEW